MEDVGLQGAMLLATLEWEQAEDDANTWTARKDGLFYILTHHRDGGRSVLDLAVFHPKSEHGILREWRWMLGSTFDRLPDGPAEGTA